MTGSVGDKLRELATDSTDARTLGLIIEAARISDRLDQIDGIITGKTDFIALMHFRVQNGDVQEVTVTLDGVLAEARQQATTLKAILAQLGVPKLEAVVKARSGVDQLKARRAARDAERPAEAEGSASS